MIEVQRRGEPFLLSIVAPVFNEENNLHEFRRRIDAAVCSEGFAYEIVFVNDGSSDASLAVMHELRARYRNVTVVNLSRNFGKEVAMSAGLAHACGQAIVVIDTDLQDPPELIPQMVALWREGADVVFAQRTERRGESWLKKQTASWFYTLMRRIGSTPIPENAGDYRLMDRRVVDALNQLPESHRFMKGLFSWVGFRQVGLPFVREPRLRGATKFNYWKLWNFALEGFTSFTIMPLKIATYLGLLVAVSAFLYATFIAFKTLVFGDPVQGFTTIMVTVLFLGGVQLIVLGVIGEYLGRVFNETKRRPLYLVESTSWSEQSFSQRCDSAVQGGSAAIARA